MKINKKLDDVLQKAVIANHPENPSLFTELKKKIPDLRTLNTLHSEKLLAYKMEPKHGQEGNNLNNEVHHNVCNYATLFPENWSQFALMTKNGHHSDGDSDNRSISSPGQNSHHGDWSGSDSKDGNDASFGSPRSISSGLSTDESATAKSPMLTSSSAKSSNGYVNGDIHENGGFSPARQMAQFHLNKRLSRAVSISASCPSNEIANHDHDDIYYGAIDGNGKNINGSSAKIRRVDSPTDSGIESGKEHCNGTPTTSVCSSPRSAMDDKVKDVSDSEGSEKQESIDDMPMLKRALQAPPLINTNMLMDEAYRHHKKFRAAARKEGEPPSPSTTTSSSGQSIGDNLASSHSTLLKTLEQPSRYMNEQQLKRTDLIHNIIMRTEAASSTSTTPTRGRPPIDSVQNSTIKNGSSTYHNGAVPHQKNGAVQSSHNMMPSIQHQQNQKGVVVCPPGYYIPSNYQTSNSCPYSMNGATTNAQQTTIMRTAKIPSQVLPSQSSSIASVPRIVYTSAIDSNSHQQSYVQQHHRRSPCSPTNRMSPQQAALVIGSNPSSQQNSHFTRSLTSSPTSNTKHTILMSQSDVTDSQPLNLSKKPSPPNSPPTDITIKIES